jgi:hypothetical protein
MLWTCCCVDDVMQVYVVLVHYPYISPFVLHTSGFMLVVAALAQTRVVMHKHTSVSSAAGGVQVHASAHLPFAPYQSRQRVHNVGLSSARVGACRNCRLHAFGNTRCFDVLI